MVSPSISHNLLYPLWNPFSILLNNALFLKQNNCKGSWFLHCWSYNCQNINVFYISWFQTIHSFLTREYCIIISRSWQFVSSKKKLIVKKNKFYIVQKKSVNATQSAKQFCKCVLVWFLFSFPPRRGSAHLWSCDRTAQVYSLSVNLVWTHVLFPRSVPKPQLWKSLPINTCWIS